MGRSRKLYHHRRLQCIRCAPCREIALEYTEKYAGELYISEAGHLEFTYSASASQALNMAFDAPIGKPFGFFCGSPAAIGLVMADLALKSSPVEIIKYMTPNRGTSHSNEIIAAVTGDASAVKNAVLTAREVGLQLLDLYGKLPGSSRNPLFIKHDFHKMQQACYSLIL